MKNVVGYIFCFMIFTLIFSTSVKAEVCDTADIARLKALARNVQMSYEHDSDTVEDYYIVNFSNFSNELVLVDNKFNQWEANDIVDGNISFRVFAEGDDIIYKVYSSECDDAPYLKYFKLHFPVYNYFSTSDECKSLEKYHLSVCESYVSKEISYDDFLTAISKYNVKEENEIIQFFQKYLYLFIIFGILVIILVVLFIIRMRKRSVLE